MLPGSYVTGKGPLEVTTGGDAHAGQDCERRLERGASGALQPRSAGTTHRYDMEQRWTGSGRVRDVA
jgi:hypothetical protein